MNESNKSINCKMFISDKGLLKILVIKGYLSNAFSRFLRRGNTYKILSKLFKFIGEDKYKRCCKCGISIPDRDSILFIAREIVPFLKDNKQFILKEAGWELELLRIIIEMTNPETKKSC